MNIFYYVVEYVSEWDYSETRTHGSKISAHNWWSAMGVVVDHIVPTLDASKILSIKLVNDAS